ncbi:MAG TPA: hypothetical protein DCQ06_02630 [Myxococcales bacterium]|nr:hypothetical protein [Myxococcales bacterium]HAN30470.1 hypothetical protein [Myxococcales bacterium]
MPVLGEAKVTTSAHYNIAIVGTDLSGLVLGALCAKAGYRVAVFGQGTQGALYEHQGQIFCRAPEMIYGISSPPMRKVFEQLGLGLELRNLPQRLDPSFQVVMPKSRVDFSTHRTRFQAEIHREFPGESAISEAFFERTADIDRQVEEVLEMEIRLPPKGIREAWQFRRLVKQFPFLDDEWAIEDPLAAFPHGHPFRAFIHAPFRFCSRMLSSRPYPATFVRIINELRKGVFTFAQGPDTLRNLFLDMISTSGDVRLRDHITRLEVKRGKVHQLMLRDRRQVVGCDLLVINTEPKHVLNLIPAEQQREEAHAAIHDLQPVYYTFTGSFLVNSRAIPENMARHVFTVFDLSKPLDEDNLVYIARDIEQGLVRHDREVRTLTATMRVPVAVASHGPAGARRLLDMLQARVEHVVPFLSEHLVSRHTPWIKVTNGTEGPRERLDPLELRPCYGEALSHTLGTSPTTITTGYRNVLLGGDIAFCGLGSDAPYVAGLHMYSLAQDVVTLKSGF